MKQEKKYNQWMYVFIIIFLVIIIIYYAAKYVSKEEERAKLKNKLKQLINEKFKLINLKNNLDRNFKIAYNLIRIIFIGFTVLISISIYKSLPNGSNSIFDFASRITDVFGALGIILIMVCLLIEENPLDAFRIRTILYNKLHSAIYDKYKESLENLPIIENEIEVAKDQLSSLDK